MYQEVEFIVIWQLSGEKEYSKKEFETFLNFKLENDNTTIEVLELDNDGVKLKLTSSVRATRSFRNCYRTKHFVNDDLLKGIDIEAWLLHVISIKEEAEIYGNK